MTQFDPGKYRKGPRLVVVCNRMEPMLHFCRNHSLDPRHVDMANDEKGLRSMVDRDIVVIETNEPLKYHLETEVMVLKLSRNCRVARINAPHHEVTFNT